MIKRTRCSAGLKQQAVGEKLPERFKQDQLLVKK
jgi:hypothetical protein